MIGAGALGTALACGTASASDPYDINVVITLSGGGTFIGKAEQQTLELLEATVNRDGGIKGQPIHFVLHDDQTQPATAVQYMNAVIAEKTPVVLGSTLASTCLAMAPLAKSGPVQYCLSPAIHPAKDSYVFSASVSTHDFAVSFYRYFRALGLKRVAMISSTDASGQDADTQFDTVLASPEFKDSGITFVDREHFNPTDLDVSAAMARIRAANPQVVICYAPGTPFGTLLRGVQQAGIDVPVATGNANMVYAEMKQYQAILPKELLFPGLAVLGGVAPDARWKDVQQQFLDAYKTTGSKPDMLSTIAWDPAMIVVDALRKYGPSASADQIRSYIADLHDYVGVSGHYDFRDGSQRGVGVNDLVIMRWDDAKQTWVALSDLGGYVTHKAH
jgi:branched-chain amino acid transport system substrate-binding protein